MSPRVSPNTVRFAIPKGRMYNGVTQLLSDAGMRVRSSQRDYRPTIEVEGFEVKILKPRAIIEMIASGARDLGFAGADWVVESDARLVEILDTGLDSVRLVAAAPEAILESGALPKRPLVVASEYASITERWIRDQGLDATLLRSYGATEVLPPEDADCIVDNTATGSTLAANKLTIIDEITTSTTRLYASESTMEDPEKRERIDRFVLNVRAVLDARTRVMLEVNVPKDKLDAVVGVLPCMREPTLSPLGSSSGFAVKAAVPRSSLARVIYDVKRAGGTDVIVTKPEQIVP